MKKLLTVILVLTLIVTVQAFSAGWQFAKVFPDTNFKPTAGVHGLAVDKAGKVWVQPFGNTDSIKDAVSNTFRPTRQVFVFNPNGTPASFSGFKTVTIGATKDTLYNSNRGMRTDADGNVVFCSFNLYYRMNYQTGAGIAKVDGYPSVTAGVTGITPAFTSANEMFAGAVIPTQPIQIFDNTFGALGTAVAAPPGFSRCLEVSKDGKDIYWCGYTTRRIYIYHSDLGTLGTYTLKDSIAVGCQVESIGWNKKDGLLYFASGNVDSTDYGSPTVDPPWKAETWYGYNVTTKTVKDSIVWNRAAYPYLYNPVTAAPRPRVIDFSVSGDTAYVGGFNYANAAVQMFTRTATSVEPVSNVVPNSYTLAQNYPNPFNPATKIEFSITKAGLTTVKVYDLLGKEVATLVDENLAPGSYKTDFDASRLSSGTYIYTLTSGGTRMSKKMLLVK
jgi:hypothetical protein